VRRITASALCGLLCLSGQAQQAASAAQTPAGTTSAPIAHSATPTPNTLMDGTAVKIRLAETISSADAKVGQQIPFEVTDDVVVDGVVVLPKGSQAVASVTDAVPKRSMGRAGKLDVNVDSARLADGEKVQLRAVKDAKGGGQVDGNFVGSTPSTVSVASGQHTITVKKKGYADWSRSMAVSGPSAHLNAELEAK
jgi:hypothetical protein